MFRFLAILALLLVTFGSQGSLPRQAALSISPQGAGLPRQSEATASGIGGQSGRSTFSFQPSTTFNGYRFYDPTLQRWLARDPLGEAGGLNLYVSFNDALWVGADLVALAADVFTGGTGGTGMELALAGTRGARAIGKGAKLLSKADELNAAAHLLNMAKDCPEGTPDAFKDAAKGLPKGAGGWKFDPSRDFDWRGTDKTVKDAIDEAFKRTGVPQDQSHPVEWRAKGGAEVNIDWPHAKKGHAEPHVGFQTPGKGNTTGHIIVDNVPYNR